MIRLAIAILLAFIAARVASAATETVSASKSDLFFQASENEVILTPGFEYNNQAGFVAGDQRKIEDSGRITKLKIETGISEDLSASFQVRYKDARLSTDEGFKADSEGIEDLHLNMTGNMALEEPTATLHYGFFGRHSVKREKVSRVQADFTGTGVDFTPLSSDPHTAGSSITPFIGYSKVAGKYLVGARFLQTIWGTKRKKKVVIEGRENLPGPVQGMVPSETNAVEEGGGATELKVFAERSYGKATLNVATKFRHTAPKREIEPQSRLVQDELDMLSLELYPSYKVDDSTTVVGGVSYTRLLNQNVIYEGEKVETGEIYNLSLGGRFTF